MWVLYTNLYVSYKGAYVYGIWVVIWVFLRPYYTYLYAFYIVSIHESCLIMCMTRLPLKTKTIYIIHVGLMCNVCNSRVGYTKIILIAKKDKEVH